jgi:16S rRNA (cytosine967-C5)-methyltransferase
VLRRSPDLKWRSQDIAGIIRLQLQLLEQSAPLVATGGRLVYATCAFEREQNESVIEAFLETQIGREFEAEPALHRLQQVVRHAANASGGPKLEIDGSNFASLASGHYLRTWPHLHGMDAYFMASLVRKQLV